MIQLSPATADFSTRKIIRYFSCGRREGRPTRGWSKRGEKNARLFGARELGGGNIQENVRRLLNGERVALLVPLMKGCDVNRWIKLA